MTPTYVAKDYPSLLTPGTSAATSASPTTATSAAAAASSDEVITVTDLIDLSEPTPATWTSGGTTAHVVEPPLPATVPTVKAY